MTLRTRYLLLFIAVLSFFWSFRWIFFEKTDLSYLKKYHEASQWQIPLSPRIMGDAQLYQYVGVQLAKGADPYAINPEVPPLGKYLYGFSILLTGNPYFVTMLFFLCSAALFAMLTKELFQNTGDRWFALAIFLVNPLLILQLPQTLMDLPQLTFLLGHLVCVFAMTRARGMRGWILAVLSGVFLGWFTGVKVGLMVVFVVATDLYLLWKAKRLRWMIFNWCCAGVAYLLVFSRYFTLGHSLLDFLRAQKWMFALYADTTLKAIPGMELITISTGFFKGWWQGAAWEHELEWSLVLPLSIVTLGMMIVRLLRKKSTMTTQWQSILILLLLLLLVNAAIPFWPRYMLLLFPLLVLVFVRYTPKISWLRWGMLAILFFQTSMSIAGWHAGVISSVADLWKNSRYEELYQYFSDVQKKDMSMENFEQKMVEIDRGFQLTQKDIQIHVPTMYPRSSQFTADVNIQTKTPIATITYNHPMIFLQHNGKWQVIWDWELIAPHFSYDSQIRARKNTPRDGVLRTRDSIILSEPGTQQYLWATPAKISNSELFAEDAAKLLLIPAKDLRISLHVLHLPNERVPLGFVRTDATEEDIRNISRWGGVTVTQESARRYNPNRDQSNATLSTIKNIELFHPELFSKPGGMIVVHQPDQQETVLSSVPAVPGKDSTLEQKDSDLFSLPMNTPTGNSVPR